MSFTTSEKVRQFLSSDFPLADRIVDQPVILSESSNVSFYGSSVDQNTVVVKSLRGDSPSKLPLTLASGSNLLSSSPLVPGSVVVASDSSLGILYTENIDYIVEYPLGRLTIKSGGALQAGQSVTVWFVPYAVYQASADYQLDAGRGSLRRLASGQILPGEQVFIDYSPITALIGDDLISSAVVTANGLMEKAVDTSGQFDEDPTLVAAATFRALEIVSLAAASKQAGAGQSGDRVALAWLKLAGEYDRRAVDLLATFRPPLTGPAAPVHS